MSSKDFGLYIPPAILQNKELIPAEKMLLAAVVPLTFGRPCTAGNDHFASQLGLETQTVSNNLNTLHQKGYIRIFLDRKAGNKREIYTYIAHETLYKYMGHPIEKFSIPLYKNFLDLYKKTGEGIEKDYRPSIKNLYTLYKNFVFNIKEEEEVEEEKEEELNNKSSIAEFDNSASDSEGENSTTAVEEKKEKPPKVAAAPPTKPKKGQPEPIIPDDWTSERRDALMAWLHYKTQRKEFYVEDGLRALITKLSKYSDYVVFHSIQESMSNGWKGLFPDKIQDHANGTNQTQRNGTSGGQYPGSHPSPNRKVTPKIDLEAALRRRSSSNGAKVEQSIVDADWRVVD